MTPYLDLWLVIILVLPYWLGGLALVAVCAIASAIEAAQNWWRR